MAIVVIYVSFEGCILQATYIDPTGKGVQLSRSIKSPSSDSVEDLTKRPHSNTSKVCVDLRMPEKP